MDAVNGYDSLKKEGTTQNKISNTKPVKLSVSFLYQLFPLPTTTGDTNPCCPLQPLRICPETGAIGSSKMDKKTKDGTSTWDAKSKREFWDNKITERAPTMNQARREKWLHIMEKITPGKKRSEPDVMRALLAKLTAMEKRKDIPITDWTLSDITNKAYRFDWTVVEVYNFIRPYTGEKDNGKIIDTLEKMQITWDATDGKRWYPANFPSQFVALCDPGAYNDRDWRERVKAEVCPDNKRGRGKVQYYTVTGKSLTFRPKGEDRVTFTIDRTAFQEDLPIAEASRDDILKFARVPNPVTPKKRKSDAIEKDDDQSDEDGGVREDDDENDEDGGVREDDDEDDEDGGVREEDDENVGHKNHEGEHNDDVEKNKDKSQDDDEDDKPSPPESKASAPATSKKSAPSAAKTDAPAPAKPKKSAPSTPTATTQAHKKSKPTPATGVTPPLAPSTPTATTPARNESEPTPATRVISQGSGYSYPWIRERDEARKKSDEVRKERDEARKARDNAEKERDEARRQRDDTLRQLGDTEMKLKTMRTQKKLADTKVETLTHEKAELHRALAQSREAESMARDKAETEESNATHQVARSNWMEVQAGALIRVIHEAHKEARLYTGQQLFSLYANMSDDDFGERADMLLAGFNDEQNKKEEATNKDNEDMETD